MDLAFVGTILLPLVGLVIAVQIYLFQRRDKRLRYRITEARLIATSKDNSAQELSEIRIRYSNVGQLPLRKDDFYTGIVTEFIGSHAVISGEQYETMNLETPDAAVTVNGRTAVVTAGLMNPAESIYVKYIVDGFARKIHVGGRLFGVKHITNEALVHFAFYWGSMWLSLYGAFVFKAWKDHETVNTRGFLVVSIPFFFFFVLLLFRIARSQHALYYIFELGRANVRISASSVRRFSPDENMKRTPELEEGKKDERN